LAYGAFGCLDTDPMPSAPSAGATQANMTVNVQYSGMSMLNFTVDIWRQTCSPQPSRIFGRLTYHSGAMGMICGSPQEFYLMQDGKAVEIMFMPMLGAIGAGAICSFTPNVPKTGLVTEFGVAVQFDRDRALTLIYRDPITQAPSSYQLTLPAGGAGPAPAAITPVNGLWWNPAESGTGYQIQTSGSTLVITIYTFKANGDPQYYLSAGPLANSGRTFVGTLDKYRAGQCISCPYTGRPILDGNDGTVRIEFSDARSATVDLPGGRVTAIVPFAF
jgi:hypothetical protein